MFIAKNLQVDNLAAISANLGTINAGTINGVDINGSKITQSFNNVVYDSQTGSKMTGQTSMHDYLLDCTYNLLNSSGAKVGSGEWSIHPLSFGLTTRGSNGAISGQVSLSGAGLMLKDSADSIFITQDTFKKLNTSIANLNAFMGQFKLISCNTPSAINTAQRVYTDSSLFGKYIVIGWGINYKDGWYQWANGTAQYLQILNDGLYVNINADVVKSKPMKVLLYKFA
jgi:hypothetical protein